MNNCLRLIQTVLKVWAPRCPGALVNDVLGDVAFLPPLKYGYIIGDDSPPSVEYLFIRKFS